MIGTVSETHADAVLEFAIITAGAAAAAFRKRRREISWLLDIVSPPHTVAHQEPRAYTARSSPVPARDVTLRQSNKGGLHVTVASRLRTKHRARQCRPVRRIRHRSWQR